MEQEEETKMDWTGHSWNPISNDDDDSASQGSTLSINSWELHFDVLREHMCVDYPNGGFVPNDRYSPELGDWISLQRVQYYKKGCGCACPLSDYKIQKLEDIGFWWEDGNPGQKIIESTPPDVVAATQKPKQKRELPSRKSKEWTPNFKKLKNHMESHYRLGGNGLCSECSDELRCWVEDQRRLYWEKKAYTMGPTISDDHIRKLENIGFSWISPEEAMRTSSIRGAPSPSAKKQKTRRKFATWETNYERLVKYVENHGSGYILPPTSDQYFYKWVSGQRSHYKLSTMPQDRIQKLESIGFLWKRPEESTATQSWSCEDDASGWLTQEEELNDSDCSNRGSLGDDESQDSAGHSATESSDDSEPCSLEERDSKAASGWLTQEEELNDSHCSSRCSLGDNESKDSERHSAAAESSDDSEPCSLEERDSKAASGWLTQEEELNDSHCSNRSRDSAGHSAAESSDDSEPCSLEERDSKAAMSTLQRKPTSMNTAMSTDIEYDREISNSLRQIAMHCRKTTACLQKKALTQLKRELAWKKKDAASKASLCASKKEIQDLKGQIQKGTEVRRRDSCFAWKGGAA